MCFPQCQIFLRTDVNRFDMIHPLYILFVSDVHLYIKVQICNGTRQQVFGKRCRLVESKGVVESICNPPPFKFGLF